MNRLGKLVVTILTLLFTQRSIAQKNHLDFGITTGILTSSVTSFQSNKDFLAELKFHGSNSYFPHYGYSYGLQLSYNISDRISIRIGFSNVSLGFTSEKFSTPDQLYSPAYRKFDHSIEAFNYPLQLKHSFGKSVRFYYTGGIYFSYFYRYIGDDKTIYYDQYAGVWKEIYISHSFSTGAQALSNFDVGVSLGVGCEAQISRNFKFQIELVKSLSVVPAKTGTIYGDIGYTMMMGSVNLLYSFDLRKLWDNSMR